MSKTVEPEKKEVNNNKLKFMIDLRKYSKDHVELANKVLAKCNEKDFGRDILPTDIYLYALNKLNEGDIKKIQAEGLSGWDKIELQLREFNQKNQSSISMEEFLVKRLRIQ